MIDMYIGLHVKHSLFLSDFNKALIIWIDFRNVLNNKCHKNPFSVSRVSPSGPPDSRTAGQPDSRTAGQPDNRTAGPPDTRTAGPPDSWTAGQT
jgi:hypothetical protein